MNQDNARIDSKEFEISGTWLPHLNFTVTVTDEGRVVNIWRGPVTKVRVKGALSNSGLTHFLVN
jgi:hypothetical protein